MTTTTETELEINVVEADTEAGTLTDPVGVNAPLTGSKEITGIMEKLGYRPAGVSTDEDGQVSASFHRKVGATNIFFNYSFSNFGAESIFDGTLFVLVRNGRIERWGIHLRSHLEQIPVFEQQLLAAEIAMTTAPVRSNELHKPASAS